MQFAKPLPDVIRGLSSLVGFDGFVVGWNVGYEVACLSIALPAIQVVDLAPDFVLQRRLRQMCHGQQQPIYEM